MLHFQGKERVPALKEEGSTRENGMERQTAENVEDEGNKGNYSGRSLLKSASMSASKCIGGKGTRPTEEQPDADEADAK
ncbi:hypothetical protein M8C21_020727 [Ambrosia artemisiifolia]|uniref:Uncharacterized protein n=1 Tax=Ambrosia artemisiifolia TaxID=4212 RepID=A0AAD5C9B1_AMBAR|nr:hypothetical protein M8C21_020727 [Ambrosia artemisiifolia]